MPTPPPSVAAIIESRRRAGSRVVATAALTACLLSAPFLLVIVFGVNPALGRRLLVPAGALAAYELLVLWLLRTGRHRAWHDWVSATVEVSIPTAIALIDAEQVGAAYALTSAPVMLYGLPVMLCAVRLRPRLALFVGALGAGQLAGVFLALRSQLAPGLVEQLPSLAAWNVLLRATYVLFAGICGWWLSRAMLALVADLAAQLAARKASEERYRTLTESSPDAILRVDGALRLRFANGAARTMLGLLPEGPEGRPLPELGLPPGTLSGAAAAGGPDGPGGVSRAAGAAATPAAARGAPHGRPRAR